MDLEIFNNMNKEELVDYCGFMLRRYRLVDSYWFLAVEEAYGRETAEQMNAKVWAREGPMTVRDLKQYFNIREKGLQGLEKVLRLFPWTTIGDHKISKQDGQIILTVPCCPPQAARLKQGLGEYDCKDMHRREFVNAASEIDPRIQVICDFAPPDPHPQDLFCRWRFRI